MTSFDELHDEKQATIKRLVRRELFLRIVNLIYWGYLIYAFATDIPFLVI